MSRLTLIRSALREGTWRGEFQLEGEAPPLELRHMDQKVSDLTPEEAGEGRLTLAVPIPVERLGDGVQTFVIADSDSGERIADFTLIAGTLADDDLRAEVELLRAELDMLKRAFRRHFLETM